MRKKNHNLLYILECNEQKFIKIGVTHSEETLDKRVKTLQTGNPYKINVAYSQLHDDALGAEKYLHRQFQTSRVMGEWFEGVSLHDIRVQLMLYHY